MLRVIDIKPVAPVVPVRKPEQSEDGRRREPSEEKRRRKPRPKHSPGEGEPPLVDEYA